jgi:FlaA1/EpsC-like NDP-sugar epimerase
VTIVFAAGTAMVLAAEDMYGVRPLPASVPALTGMFVFLAAGSFRSMGRLSARIASSDRRGRKRLLVAGAGDAGSLLLRDIENQPELGIRVIGFLDDDPRKKGWFVRGVRVLGGIGGLPQHVRELQVDEVFVAIPSATPAQRRRVLELCEQAEVPVRVMASLTEAPIAGVIADLRTVRVDDLLGREPVCIDVEAISESLTDKVVAVTGAAGSIGAELCRQIMEMGPRRLLLFEVDESRLYELYLELARLDPTVPSMQICDIREAKVADVLATNGVDVVFHAAAYKHVPLMELAPDEAVMMNIGGTRAMLQACATAGVERFVLISTDKAVEPVNVMGATKAVAERLALLAAKRGLGTTIVRFGNVLGSRGSVVPLFEEQLRSGIPLRVTHPEATRYFMTIPEAARLVLQAQAMSDGGDLFVLDMGEPIRIADLARRMIALSGADTRIEYQGLRPGEKLHEVLVHANEELLPTQCEKVRKLNALPLMPDDFEMRVSELLALAQVNRGAEALELMGTLLPQFACDRLRSGSARERLLTGEETRACRLVR